MRPLIAPPPLLLAYHGVDEVTAASDPHRLVVAPDDLRRHIDRLRRWGYDFVTFGTIADVLAADAGDARGLVALTFDDGFADNLRVLAPLLAAEDVPATVFAVPGLAGAPHPDVEGARFATHDELRELARHVEVGAHSLRHRDLTELSEDEVVDDLTRCREELESLVGGTVDLLAYPYGSYDDRVVRAARRAGFRAACTTSGNGSLDEPLLLPRQDMGRAATLTGLRLKRDDRYEQLVSTLPGRVARRVCHAAMELRW